MTVKSKKPQPPKPRHATIDVKKALHASRRVRDHLTACQVAITLCYEEGCSRVESAFLGAFDQFTTAALDELAGLDKLLKKARKLAGEVATAKLLEQTAAPQA
jgi:hypothetical protein